MTAELPADDPHCELFAGSRGTLIDHQLHQELCTTRLHAYHLLNSNHDNAHAQTLVPAVYHFTALAKVHCTQANCIYAQ